MARMKNIWFEGEGEKTLTGKSFHKLELKEVKEPFQAYGTEQSTNAFVFLFLLDLPILIRRRIKNDNSYKKKKEAVRVRFNQYSKLGLNYITLYRFILSDSEIW